MPPHISIDRNVAEAGATLINNVNFNTSYSNDEIDHACLRALRCPDSLVVKNRLRESKDELLQESFDWILHDPDYIRWQDDNDIRLLWIKGGAGKGKTMISIGLIEELIRKSRATPAGMTAVTYFFCQNADHELNTMEAIIKGLILQLIKQQPSVKELLRDRWGTSQQRFHQDISSWRGLWNILMEMLEHCTCRRIYAVVDALDECQPEGIADLLKVIVRIGLARSSRVKWLLTSRPLDSAEQELLTGSDQLRVSLELNAQHISRAVRAYIVSKVAELNRRQRYESTLRQHIKEELDRRAEDTFLWVHLVCKKLESVHRDNVLTTIQEIPPGLDDFYDRMLGQLCQGESLDVKGCVRLLQALMLVYRPLHILEVSSVTGLFNEQEVIKSTIERSASFVKVRGQYIEFVHQSTRDYLAEGYGCSVLKSVDQFGHGEMAVKCLNFLLGRLKPDLLDLLRPDTTKETAKEMMKEGDNELFAGLSYAAEFWFQHIKIAKDDPIIRGALTEDGMLERFLRTRFLEWLECLSLLDQLPRAFEALKTLSSILTSHYSFLLAFVQDASEFLLQHYQTISNWPLQVYSSAIIFSPEQSVVKRENLSKIPYWLTKAPKVEKQWISWVYMRTGHSHWVTAVAFSPNGQRIALGSWDNLVRVCDATTGQVKQTLEGHSDLVSAVSFSPDGRRITSGSHDKTVRVWDATTGQVEQALTGHSGWVLAVVFSPDGRRIVSGSYDMTVRVWDATTGQVEQTLTGHSDLVWAVAFSPDGRRIASGSTDKTVRVWDATTGQVEQTLIGHSDWVRAVAFSPDGQRIVSGSGDETVRVWNATTGQVEQTLEGHLKGITAVAFSPDGRRIASGSGDNTVRVWDATTEQVEQTLADHSDSVSAVVFSPDGRHIASGSWDNTVRVWDATTGQVEQTLTNHSDTVSAVSFSPDGQRIASGSHDNKVRVRNATTGQVERTLAGHSHWITAVAFSPDGRHIASGSWDKTVRVWNVDDETYQQIQTSRTVLRLCFSTDGTFLITNRGSFEVGVETAGRHSQNVESPCYLRVDNDRWIYCGSRPVLRLPAGFRATAYSAYGDQLVIGFDDGRVLTMTIDSTGFFDS